MQPPTYQAAITFTRIQEVIFIALLASGVTMFAAFGFAKAALIVIALASLLYFCDMLFNLVLVVSSLNKSNEYSVDAPWLSQLRQWPRYTVFCPLYREVSVLHQFVAAMERLNYPKDKLQILLLLEEDDIETIIAARRMRLGRQFEIVIVPDSQPKTKPKAINHGLTKAQGTYAVIYDAEDIPDPDQLKKAVVAFEHAPTDVACMQAKLNFYNPHQNILTRMFAAEYSLWFNLILVGLQNIRGPIPLGGTSNHFKIYVLRGLGGWDPYNVTEDCDLGMRLYKQGFHTGILDSTTYEEANSRPGNWIRQRSRWVKGYMQTFLVHNRHPRQMQKHPLDAHLLTFNLVVGGKVLSMLINPIMWVLTIIYFVFRPFIGLTIDRLYPAPIFYIAATTLIVGNLLYMYYFMLGCANRKQWHLIKYVLFVPVYWLMMSLGAAYALYQLLIKPHYWEKTTHGLHLATANND